MPFPIAAQNIVLKLVLKPAAYIQYDRRRTATYVLRSLPLDGTAGALLSFLGISTAAPFRYYRFFDFHVETSQRNSSVRAAASG